MPCQSRNCNKHGYLICLHWLWLCVRVCRFAPKMLAISENGSCLMDYSNYFHTISVTLILMNGKNAETRACDTTWLSTVKDVLLNIQIALLWHDPIYAETVPSNYIIQQGLALFFTDTQLYQTINMYEMFVLVQIFLCSEMTSNDALFVLLFLFRSLVRFQSRHILNLMILITLSKYSLKRNEMNKSLQMMFYIIFIEILINGFCDIQSTFMCNIGNYIQGWRYDIRSEIASALIF